MFSELLNTDYIDNLKEKAKKDKIKKDRDKFQNFLKDVEIFISENNLLISDIDMLLNKEILYKESYTIYCDNPFRYANNLVNILSEKREKSKKNKTLVLKTMIAHRRLSIAYENRNLVFINSISTHGILQNNINKIINPIEANGFYSNKKILLIPYEIELIDIYRSLYNPEMNSEWIELVASEKNLIKEVDKRIKQKIFTGGENIDIDSIKKIIMFHLLDNTNYVLIGEWAISLIEFGITGGKFKGSQEKIQIISQQPIEIVFDEFKKNIESIFNNNPFEITYKEHELFIPKDYRIRRYTVYIQTTCNNENSCPVKQKNIMDIFTNATYELIPWILSNRFSQKKNKEYPKNIKLGNPFVLLRFLLIDLWILRIIYNRNLITKNIIEKKINRIWNNVNKIRNPNRLGGLINKTFSLKNYIGFFRREDIYFMSIIKEKFVPDYYPYKWKKDNFKYRNI